jgi:hypothetical protein
MGRIIPYIMENTKCLKPPTRYSINYVIYIYICYNYKTMIYITLIIYIYKYLVGAFNPLKNVKISWDYEIPNISGKNVPNHQPDWI